jgi:hypothetical protein
MSKSKLFDSARNPLSGLSESRLEQLTGFIQELLEAHPILDSGSPLQASDRVGGFSLVGDAASFALLSCSFYCGSAKHLDRAHWAFRYLVFFTSKQGGNVFLDSPLVADQLLATSEWVPNFRLTHVLWAESLVKDLRLPFKVNTFSLEEARQQPLLQSFTADVEDEGSEVSSVVITLSSAPRLNQSVSSYAKEVRNFLEEIEIVPSELSTGMYL